MTHNSNPDDILEEISHLSLDHHDDDDIDHRRVFCTEAELDAETFNFCEHILSKYNDNILFAFYRVNNDPSLLHKVSCYDDMLRNMVKYEEVVLFRNHENPRLDEVLHCLVHLNMLFMKCKSNTSPILPEQMGVLSRVERLFESHITRNENL
jgi:hypothetical protein